MWRNVQDDHGNGEKMTSITQDITEKNGRERQPNSQNLGSQDAVADVRPSVEQTVLAATRIAGQRRMPLRVESLLGNAKNGAVNGNVSNNSNVSNNGNGSNGNGANGKGANGNGANGVANGVFSDFEYSNGARKVDISGLLETIAPQMQCVEDEIARLLTSPIKLVSDIAGHTLGAGGKRLRPALTIFASQLCSGNVDARALTCAAVMEITHTTALIHDDVVDNAQTRRGKPAANLLWGNETSVLVGDYLSAQAFVALTKPDFYDVLPFVAQTTSELCAGELLETQTRGLLSLTEEQYLDIIALKTASLTSCACRVGAITGDATDDEQEKLARYGRFLGLAFQIVDDVFDVVSNEIRVGKPVGNDIREGDITLPMLRAMQVIGETERDEMNAIVGKDPISDEEVARALEILRGCDAVEYSMSRAARFVEAAKNELQDFADCDAKSALVDIANYVLSREK